ncbi:hypothetical protein ACWEKT_25625 [Nocardia takedensis]
MTYTWTRPTVAPSKAGPDGRLPARSTARGEISPTAAQPLRTSARPDERAQAGELLVQLFGYLDQYAEAHPALVAAIPRLREAVAHYRTGSGTDPFEGVRAVVAVIDSVRASDPALPEP